MSSFTRLVAALAFSAAALAQPLALDACALSCEAARAARVPSVAPPCHHTTSCATQISQPTAPGSTPTAHAVLPAVVTVELARPATAVRIRHSREIFASPSPPTITQLRV